jgi:hypothetical protein
MYKHMTMELTRSEGRPIRNPTVDDVEAALSELDLPEGFLILAKAEQEYVQAAGTCLEYRDASGHFRATMEQDDRGAIRRVFLAYLAGDAAWRTMVPWRDVSKEIGSVAGIGWRWIVAVFVILVIGYIVYRYLLTTR